MPKFDISEYMECATFYEWAMYQPVIKDYLYKIVNEGKRSKYGGMKFVQIGLRAGIPDYHYPVPNAKYCGLWIEMKKKSGRVRATWNQESWIEKLNKIGHYAGVTYGADEAIKLITDYVNNRL